MRIAAIITVFPSLTETFVFGDLLALQEAGHDLALLKFMAGEETLWQSDAQALRGSVLSGGRLFSGRVLLDSGRVMLASPFKSARVLARVLLRSQVSRRAFLKTVAILPRCLQMVREVKKWRADLVHATWANHSAVAAMVIKEIAGIPYSMSAHAGQDVFREPFMLAEKVAGAKFVSVCNRHAMERLQSEASPGAHEKIHYVPHGVDLARFAGGDPEQGKQEGVAVPRILFVGRLDYGKGLPYLMQAAQLLHERGQRFILEILGQGPDLESLRDEVAKRRLESCVRFRGAVSQEEVACSLFAAHMLALPSEIRKDGGREGLPNVILEAMASGTAVVASRIASVEEAIEDDVTGLLVPQKDPQALARAMERILLDGALRNRLARNGRKVATERFDSCCWRRRFVALFEAAR